MRAVAQRVSSARVQVGDDEVSRMGPGLLALVGVGRDDAEGDAQELARKLVGLRVFPDADGRMNHSLLDVGGTLGIVSQFTLLADTSQGRRPSFQAAAPADRAEPLVVAVMEGAQALGATVVGDRFGAHMRVELCNDGPVTLWLDTRPGVGSPAGR